ncbi:MAG: FG-GAP-like repeat-containing protein [Oscillospiraceae bacterium]|nr:FG-GAP-like repeat-containing protein [Oscillospiraceae bacterium]
MKHRMLHRALGLMLLLALACGLLGASAAAAEPTALEKADALHALGLFLGKGTLPDGTPDYALDVQATRNEAATMLIRLLGRESKALAQHQAGALVSPFQDSTPWAEAYVTWLYEAGQINGTTTTTFSGDQTITAQQFSAMVLRSLGYNEAKGDFAYADALDYAVSKGLMTAEQREAWSGEFLRAGMAEICYNALYIPCKDSSLTLLEKLENDGIFRPSYDTAVADTPAMSLKSLYLGGGSINKWSVEEPASAEPAVADLDGDGKTEIIFAVRTVYCLNGANGTIRWSTPSGHDTSENAALDQYFGAVYLAPQVLDLDGDGALELLVLSTNYVYDQTFVAVYNAKGQFESHFTTPHVARACKAADLDGDGRYELAMGFGVGGSGDGAVCVYDLNGNVRSGWPQSCGYGLYSNSMEAVDLDGDGVMELVMLFDEDQIAAFHLDGSPVLATGSPYTGLAWKGIPLAENYAHELEMVAWARKHGGSASGQGLVGETRESRNINTGTFGAVKAVDVDGDGTQELVFVSMILDGGLVMRNGGQTYQGVARYFTTFLLNLDRTRYSNEAKGFDWTQFPTDVGEIVSLGDDPQLPTPELTPVVVDLDGDGNREILYSSFDGALHCFSLDGTEHGAWPYVLDTRKTQVLSFATKPAVGDLNGDGKLEVVFATYTSSDQVKERGKLIVLDYSGKKLAETTLPPWWGYQGADDLYYADGSRAAPVLADVNGDGKLDIVVSTLSSGVCVYNAN